MSAAAIDRHGRPGQEKTALIRLGLPVFTAAMVLFSLFPVYWVLATVSLKSKRDGLVKPAALAIRSGRRELPETLVA